MKIYKITNDHIIQAKNWCEFKGNDFSIRQDGINRFVGSLAEVIFQETYPSAIRISNIDFNADFILNDKRIDVKCKERSVFCKDYYEVSIEERQLNFNVDWYAFYSYNNIEQIIEFLGWKSKNDFIYESTQYKKGDVDPANNWKVSVDCRNLKIADLIK